MAVGTLGVVGDGEVAGVKAALRMLPDEDALVLSDSTAALASISTAGQTGKARSRDLREVLEIVGDRSARGLATRFGLCKAHVGIEGMRGRTLMGKLAARGCPPPR